MRHASTSWLLAGAAAAALTLGCSREAQNDASREAGEAVDTTARAAREAGGELGDAWTTTKIEAKYFGDATVKGRNIDVTTRNGVVTLTGIVDSDRAKQQAVTLARQTEGVTSVEDKLVVQAGSEPGASASRDSARVDRPAATTGAVSGVTPEVRDGGDATAATAPHRPNAWVTTQVQAKYFADPTVKARRIDVATNDGVVTLTGTVGSEAERQQAVRLARGSDGVRRVDDQLRVSTESLETPVPVSGAAATAGTKGQEGAGPVSRGLAKERTSDAGITARVQSKFFLNDTVKARNIDVTTDNGTVTLRGTVTNDSERQEALSIARSVDGVKNVTDDLQLATAAKADASTAGDRSDRGPLDTVEDAWVTTKIQSKYFVDDLVKGRRVDVTTQNGVVTLAGQVQSDAEKQRAEALARQTEGVIRVQNRLTIGSGETTDASPMP